MALCAQSDLEALRQIDVIAEPDTTVTALIRHAEGILEGVTGRRFDPVTSEVVTIDDSSFIDASVLLPHYPVTAVVVKNPDDSVVDSSTYQLQRFGVVSNMGVGTGVYAWDWQYNVPQNSGLTPWQSGTTFTYDGGIDDPADAPQALRTLCAQIVAELFDIGTASLAQGGAGIQSETLGGWSVSYMPNPKEIQLSPTQRRVARAYAHRLPVVAV